MPTYTTPHLNSFFGNVAGILPLSALLDFTDAEQTLHSYQLSGRGLPWNWIVTPAGSRLLISNDGTRACCLDRTGAGGTLHCMDGRWGDAYPCSNPSTVRTCMDVAKSKRINLPSASYPDGGDRPQRLRIIRASLAEEREIKSPLIRALSRLLGRRITRFGWHWVMVCTCGWLVYFSALAGTLLSGLYVSSAYLVVLLCTGIVVRFSHGHRARRIQNLAPSIYSRLIVATDNLNGNDWTAFIGPTSLVNPLLNKPLYQIDPPTHLPWLRFALHILIMSQWGLTVVACAFQDWNAYVVFAWIALCACISTWVFGEQGSTKSWLRSNGVRLEKVEVELSCRRSMLSLLVALNPDRKATQWIDPILAKSEDRAAWEAALQLCLDKESWEQRSRECLDSGMAFVHLLIKEGNLRL